MLHRQLLLLGLLLAFVGCKKGDKRIKVYCDVTGYPWHPEKGCKVLRKLLSREWNVALIEHVTHKSKKYRVIYACPLPARKPYYVSFCHTIQGLDNATAVWHDLGDWPEEPIELDVQASDSIQWLVNFYLDKEPDRRHRIGNDEHVKRSSDFKYQEKWIPTTTSTTTTTTTTEPEPTESEEDKLRHQLAIEQADAAYYRFMLLFISFAVAVAILGTSHYIKYRTVVKAQRLYGPQPTVNKTPPDTPAPKPEEPPKSVYVPPSSNDTPL